MKHATNAVRLKSNGDYWQAAWRANGQTKVKSLGNKSNLSKREALAACKDIEREHLLNPGRVTAGQAPTLEAWTNEYKAMRTDLDPATLAMHETTIAYMIENLGAGRRLDKIARLDAANFRKWLGTKKGSAYVEGTKTKEKVSISDASVCRHIRNAKTIMEKAKDLDLIAINPFDRERGTPAEVEHNWRDLDDKTIATLIEKSPTDDWRRLFALCAYAGLRRGEALRLKWTDINLDKHRLTVRTKAGKKNTKQKVREVLIVPELQRLIEDRATTSHPQLVANVPDHNIERDATAVIAAAGLTPWSPPFHTLRKWRATTWRGTYPESVVDSWLGHSLQVARKHYVKVDERYYGAGPNIHALAAQLKALPAEALAAIMATLGPTKAERTNALAG